MEWVLVREKIAHAAVNVSVLFTNVGSYASVALHLPERQQVAPYSIEQDAYVLCIEPTTLLGNMLRTEDNSQT